MLPFHLNSQIAKISSCRLFPVKTFFLSMVFLVAFLLLPGIYNFGWGQSQTFNTAGTYSFTVPAGVTSITVQAWGGGGGGAGDASSGNIGNGGGGGGAYAKVNIYSVTPGTSYQVIVGAGGSAGIATDGPGGAAGNSTFNTSICVAAGGLGGQVNAGGGTGGSGGLSASSTGDVRNNGGNGATGNSSAGGIGGGGGGSAGTAAIGNAGNNATGGAAVTGGGAGGNGGSNSVGLSGSAPGGGGGGAEWSGANHAGGAGAPGQVIITWTCPPDAGTLSGTQTICVGATTTFSSTVLGGVWSSGNAGVATINSSTGLVTGISAGGPVTMTYTVNAGGSCSVKTATRTVTVNATPSAPTIGTITQPTCSTATGSVDISGLPAGDWTLTRNPGGVITTGTGTSTTLSGLTEGIYTYTVSNGDISVACPGSGTGLIAEYYNNMILNGLPALTRTDATVNFDWGNGNPGSPINNDNFSARWTGKIQPCYSETYTFTTRSDDGIRLWVNGTQIINNWTDHGATNNTGSISLIAGQKYDIILEYYENGGGAVAQLSWNSPSQTIQIIPQSQLYSIATGCTSVSSANVVINAVPVVPATPTASVTVQPTCSVPTGTIVITAPTGAQYEYQLDGGTYQASATFSGVAVGNHTVKARLAASPTCISPASTSMTVNAVPTVPATPTANVTVQPTCSVPTGTIVITAPTGAQYEYQLDGGTYQTSATFSGVAVGNHTVKVRLAASPTCISPASTSMTVNAVPTIPATPTASVTVQPTCALSTGTIVITAPIGPQYEYQLGAGAYQTSTTFTGVSSGSRAVNARLIASPTCISSVATLTVNAQPSPPAAPTTGAITQPTCALTTGSVALTGLPTGTWTINPGNISGSGSSTTVTNLSSGTYNFTVTNSVGCTSSGSSNVVINSPTLPTIIGSSGSRCGPGTVSLGANASAGTINWYDAGGTFLTTGSTYTTPNLSSTTTYYVDATIGSCTTPRTAVLAVIIPPASISVSGAGNVCLGSTLNLTSIGAGITNQYWQGPNGFYSLLPNVVINNIAATDAGTYTVTGSALSGINLVANGDFELGNIGFGSSYGYVVPTPAALQPEGLYTIVASPASVHGNFSPCANHTPTGTLQMVINGAANSKNIWTQTVNVVPNTDYQFTYWVQSVNPQSPSQSQLYVNDAALGASYTADATTCTWKQFVYNWNSGANNTAKLDLRNLNLAAGGNDFAIDDIIFQQVCPATASGVVTIVDPPTAGAIGNTQTICNGYTPDPISSVTAGTNVSSYEWQSDASGSYVTIPGEIGATYTPPALSKTTSYQRRTIGTACNSVYTTPVTIIVNGPTINAGGPDLACQSAGPSPITLSGASFGPGASEAAWSIISGLGTLSSTAPTATPASVTYTPAANFSGTVTLQLQTNKVVSLGNCDAIANRIITFRPTITASISGTTSVCQNAATPVITFTNPQAFPITITYNINGTVQTPINVGANTTATVSAPTTSAGTFAYNLVSAIYQTGPSCSINIAGAATVTVNPTLPVSVSISASANPVCYNTLVTFTATPTNGGASPAYQWKVNGVNAGTNSATFSYTPLTGTGDAITCVLTSNATPCISGNPATSNTVNMTFNPATTAGTLTPTPAVGAVCSGTTVSATATAGSGGIGPTDKLEYRFDGGTWTAYTSGTSLNTNSHTSVDIQTYRTTTGSGCTQSATVMVSWTINAVPASGTLTPNFAAGAVCAGTTLWATATAGSGGAGTIADVLQYQVDGSGWLLYTSGSFLSTMLHTSVDIQTYRTATGSNCTTSTPNIVSWTVNSLPAASTAGNILTTYDGLLHTGTATPPSGSSIVWYDASTNGNITVAPSGSNVGTYFAWAESVDNITGCKSASRTQVTVTINKATPTLSVTNTPQNYTGSPIAATVSGTGGGVVSNIKYGGSSTAPTNAGTYAITADIAASANYTAAAGASAGNFVIGKATPTLSVTNSPATYTGAGQSATVSGSVAGTVSSILTGGAATQTASGTYAVTANFVPTDATNYISLTAAAAGNFIINKATPTLSVTNTPQNYTGSLIAATVSGTGGGVVTNIKYSGSSTAPTNAGTYAITADIAASTNYTAATGASAGNFVISPIAPVLTVTNSPQNYTGSPIAATVSGTGGGVVSNIKYGGSSTAPTNVGTYAITADIAASTNYTAATGASAGNFVISPIAPVLTVINTPQNYTGSPIAATVSGTGGGVVSNIKYGGSSTAPTNAGTYAITADIAASANYTAAAGASAGNFVIGKATPTLSVTNSPATYTGAGQSATVSGSVAGTVSSILTGGAATQTASGTYAVTANFVPTDATNYISLTAAAAGNFIINKATPTLSVTNSPATYTGAGQSATVSGSVAGTVSSILTGGAATQSNAGTYAVTANFVPTDATNYNSLTAAAAGIFIINKATPTLSVTNSPVTYTGAGQSATVSGSVAGTVSSIITGGAATQTSAGTYAVTANFVPTDATNYNSLTAATAGNFIINKATPTLSVTNTPQNYNGSPIAAIVSGTGDGAISNIKYSGSSTVPTIAGTYTITADIAASANYTAVAGAAAGNLVINNATLTITAVNQTKCFGQTLIFTGTEFSSIGLMSGDAISSVTLTSSGSSDVSAAGIYTIVPSSAIGNGLSNYTITYSSAGTLTVSDLPTGTLTNSGSICSGASTSLTFTKTAGTGPFDLVINGTTYPDIASGGTINISPTDLSTTYTLTSITDKGVSPNCPNIVNVSTTVSVYPIEVNATLGLVQACYNTVKDAFAKVNDGTHKGVITFKVHGSTTETASAILNASGGSSSYTSVLLYPTTTGLSISGNLSTPLIDLSGADNVIIDGRVNATGSFKDLTISNSSVTSTASTIRFISDASANIVQYCTIQGSSTAIAIGTIFFSIGTTAGNDENTITNNTITLAGSNLPVNAIYSAGTAGKENSANTISNNDIQDFYSVSLPSNGIYVASNSSAWTISGNKLFQTANRTSTVSNTHRGINISTASGTGYMINNNIIGYSNTSGTGSTTYDGAVANLYRGIEMTVGTTLASSVQGNIIDGISFSTTSASALPGIFSGISVLAGKVDIGTVTGNTIGAITGNGSIAITSTTTGGIITGIYSTSTSTVNIQNNTIGSISTAGLDVIGYTFHGIYTAGALGNCSIASNIIGSTNLSTSNSISIGNATTTVVCTLNGINNAATGTISITGNTIQNATVNGTVASVFNGILNTAGSGALNINNNNIFSGKNTGTGAFTGISNSSTAATTNINSNIIRNITRTTATGTVSGISSTGAITASLNISDNHLGNTDGGFVTYAVANSSTLTGINVSGATAASTLSIQNNDIMGIVHTIAGTNTHNYIINTAATKSQNISTNTFTNLDVNTTGSVTFISNSVIMPANGSQTISGNKIVTGFNKGGAGNTVTGITSTAATANAGVTVLIENNNFSNISVTGATAINGIVNTDTGAGNPTKTIRNNTLADWAGGTSAMQGMSLNNTGTSGAVTGNTIRNFSNGNSITGITTGAGNDNIYSNQIYSFNGITTAATIVTGITVTASTTKNVYLNTIYDLNTGAGVTTGSVRGISITAGTTINAYQNTISGLSGNALTTGSVNGLLISGGTTVNAYQNTISGLSGNALTSGTVNGISITGGSMINVSKNKVYDLSSSGSAITGTINGIVTSSNVASLNATIVNNIIGDLWVTAGSGTDLIRGISVANTGTTSNANVYYNTVYLNASSTGTNFGTSGIYHAANATATTAALDLRNNIIINTSIPNGSGFTVAFRRSTVNLSNYAISSNNNLFYTGTPGTNRLIYRSTISYQNLSDFQSLVSPREVQSLTEDMTTKFLSTTGSDATFLHIDPTKTTLAESGAATIVGIMDDFDGDLRQGNAGYFGTGAAPDIGADEFEGICMLSITSATAAASPICANTTTTLTANGVSGTGTIVTWWSGPLGTGTNLGTGLTLVAGPGTYYARATNGCGIPVEVSVTVVANPLPIPTFTAQPGANACLGYDVTYTTEASMTSYIWGFQGVLNTDYRITSGGTGASNTVTLKWLTEGNKTVSVNYTNGNNCTAASVTSSNATMVNPIPSAIISYTGSPFCFNTGKVTVVQTGTSGGTYSSVPSGLTINATTGEINTITSNTGTYTVTYTVVAAAGCNILETTTTLSIFNDLVWTGNLSTDWNIAGNWTCNAIPDLTTNVLIPDVPNKPILNTGNKGTAKDITIAINSSLTVTGNTLQISGDIKNEGGTITASEGTIEMVGTTSNSIASDVFTGNTIMNLTINKTNTILNTNIATLLRPLNVTGIVKVIEGNLASDGKLTLISTSLQTALIEGSGNGNVNGDVTMQRYLPSGFGYKYFSSPFSDATVDQFKNVVDLRPVVDPLAVPLVPIFPNFYKYDENNHTIIAGVTTYTSGWVKYIDPINPLVPMYGYAANFGKDPATKTVKITGNVNNGDQSISLSNNSRPFTTGFNLVGNPYPSPIDRDALSGWIRTNVDKAIWLFNASTTDQYGGVYSSYVNEVYTDPSSNTTSTPNIIPSMQGFFVHVTNLGSGSLTMTNKVRTTNLSPTFKAAYFDPRTILRFAANFDEKNGLSDGYVLYFDPLSTMNFDSEKDAMKMMNTDLMVPNLYSITPDVHQLSIKAMPSPIDSLTKIYLGIKILKDGWVNFNASDISKLPSNMHLYLIDAVENITQDLKQRSSYRFYLKKGEYNQRFTLVFSLEGMEKPTEIVEKMFTITRSGERIYVKVNLPFNTNGDLIVTNMQGKTLLQKGVTEMETVEIDPNVGSGVYIVTMISGKRKESEKILMRKDYE